MYPKLYQNDSKCHSQKKQILLQSPSNDPWWQTAHPTFPTKQHPFWCFGPGKHVMKPKGFSRMQERTQSKASGINPARWDYIISIVGHSWIYRKWVSSYKSNFHWLPFQSIFLLKNPVAEYPGSARSKWLSSGLSTSVDSGGSKFTKLRAPKVEQKQGQVDPTVCPHPIRFHSFTMFSTTSWPISSYK